MTTESKSTVVERVQEWETPYGLVKLGIETVRAYFCPKATDQEIMHFMAVCRYHKLNPWLREAYIIKYEDGREASIVMGKWAHARKAEEHPQYAGTQSGIIIQTEDGEIERREGTFFLEPEKLVGGWAKVYRKDRDKPEFREVRLQDWFRVGPYWKSSPAHMINKVAVSQARHEAFPGEYTDLISDEEAQSGPGIREPITINMPQSNAEAAAEKPESPAAPTDPSVESNGKESLVPPAGDINPDADLESEARAREEAEATRESETTVPAAPAPIKIDRGKVWNALLRKAKAENKNAVSVLRELTGKSGMTELDDGQILELAKKLGA